MPLTREDKIVLRIVYLLIDWKGHFTNKEMYKYFAKGTSNEACERADTENIGFKKILSPRVTGVCYSLCSLHRPPRVRAMPLTPTLGNTVIRFGAYFITFIYQF